MNKSDMETRAKSIRAKIDALPVGENLRKMMYDDLADAMVDGMENGRISDDEATESSKFVLERLDNVNTFGQLKAFLHEFADRWTVYRDVWLKYLPHLEMLAPLETLDAIQEKVRQSESVDTESVLDSQSDELKPLTDVTNCVFISYSSRDERVAVKIANSLKGVGCECWLDKKDILIGEPILDRVREGIARESDYTVILLSKNSVRSEWCKLELRMAYDKEIRLKRVVVLPIRIDQANVPEEVKTKKYYQLDPNSELSFDNLAEEIKSLVRRQV